MINSIFWSSRAEKSKAAKLDVRIPEWLQMVFYWLLSLIIHNIFYNSNWYSLFIMFNIYGSGFYNFVWKTLKWQESHIFSTKNVNFDVIQHSWLEDMVGLMNCSSYKVLSPILLMQVPTQIHWKPNQSIVAFWENANFVFSLSDFGVKIQPFFRQNPF